MIFAHGQKGEKMTDLIDRQKAIDAIHYEYDDCCNIDESGNAIADDIERIIDNVPSVQPDIIRCKDCIYQTESWSGIKYCEAHGDHIGKDYDYCSNARRKENG